MSWWQWARKGIAPKGDKSASAQVLPTAETNTSFAASTY